MKKKIKETHVLKLNSKLVESYLNWKPKYNLEKTVDRILIWNSQVKKNPKNDELIENISKIENISVPEFPITGEYLLDKGIKSGKKMGYAIREIKNKWLENNFNLDDEQLSKTIKKFK